MDALIMQVRSGSSRLRNKMLMPFFQGKTIPQVIIKKIREGFPSLKLIVATTEEAEDDLLVEQLISTHVEIFRGPEDDVLSRFIKVGKKYGIENFVRICGDNPFLDICLLKELMDNWTNDLDYLAHMIDGKPSMKTAYGFFAEISKMSAMKRVDGLTKDILYREHVTNFIYTNPSIFNVKLIKTDAIISNSDGVRLTVDTERDFKTAAKIYEQVSTIFPKFSYREVLHFLENETIIQEMKIETEKNRK